MKCTKIDSLKEVFFIWMLRKVRPKMTFPIFMQIFLLALLGLVLLICITFSKHSLDMYMNILIFFFFGKFLTTGL